MTFPLIGKLQRTDHNKYDAEDDDDMVQSSGNRPCWDHHNNDAENLTPCSETLARRPLLEMDDDDDDDDFVVDETTMMILMTMMMLVIRERLPAITWV